MLIKQFDEALESSLDVADNFYLRRMRNALQEVEGAAAHSQALKQYVSLIEGHVERPGFELEPQVTNEIAQLLGEAHFWLLCDAANVNLNRVPEQGKAKKKTPDFESADLPGKLHFEVKTLSVSDGACGVAAAIRSSLAAKIELEQQQRAGRRVAIVESVIAPYGQKCSGQAQLLQATRFLIEKIRQNVKVDQFANPNTFLVLNLSMLGPWEDHPRVLRPSFPETQGLFPCAISGQLWLTGFGQRDMLIQNQPEFEGLPCVEGVLDKQGILHEFPEIAGLLFVVHPVSAPTAVWGLFRNQEILGEEQPEVLSEILKLVGDKWNDAGDRNGWRLQ